MNGCLWIRRNIKKLAINCIKHYNMRILDSNSNLQAPFIVCIKKLGRPGFESFRRVLALFLSLVSVLGDELDFILQIL